MAAYSVQVKSALADTAANGPGTVLFAPSAIQMASPPTPQLPLRATTRPMAPNCRLFRMSENDASTTISWPFTAVVPFIPAPMKYGATVTFHASPAGVCADAGDAAMTVRTSMSKPIAVLCM